MFSRAEQAPPFLVGRSRHPHVQQGVAGTPMFSRAEQVPPCLVGQSRHPHVQQGAAGTPMFSRVRVVYFVQLNVFMFLVPCDVRYTFHLIRCSVGSSLLVFYLFCLYLFTYTGVQHNFQPMMFVFNSFSFGLSSVCQSSSYCF